MRVYKDRSRLGLTAFALPRKPLAAGTDAPLARLQQALLFEQARRAVAAAQRLEDALVAAARSRR